MTSKGDKRLSALIRDGLRHLEHAESGDEDDYFDFATEVGNAINAFKEATKLAPDEPWLWFQIGWWSSFEQPDSDDVFEDDVGDWETSRHALDRTLLLDPGNVAAHMLLAYRDIQAIYSNYVKEVSALFYGNDGYSKRKRRIKERLAISNEEATRSLVEEQLSVLEAHTEQAETEIIARRDLAVWDGPPGEHIRTGMNSELIGSWYFHRIPAEAETDVTHWNYPFATERSFWRFVDILDNLGEFLPASRRPGYYNWVGMCFVNGWSQPYDKRWFEHGAKWASDDTDYETLFLLFAHLGGAYAESTPPDYLAAYKSLQQAYSYLIGMPDREWGYSYWLSHISRFNAWDPGDDWPIFQQVLDLALDQTPFRKTLTELDGNLTLVDFAETGARMALKRGERQVAIGYLLQAQNLDPTHITIAKLLVEVYLDEKRWSKALQELRKVSAINPADEQAVRLIPVLELAQEGTLNKQARDLILTVLPDLRAGQEMILDELSLQRDLMQRVADAQNRAQIELGQPRNEERAYAELFDQLHRLVQKGSRIQPAAWHSARSRLVDKLGSEVYGSLQGTDSQHFLITAEVFFTASRDVKAMTDAAPIAVEYAKVVETELKDRFLSDLGAYLDLKKHVQGLRCGDVSIGKQQAESWMVAMKKLGLGQVGHLLMSIAGGVNDDALGDYLKSRGIRRDLLNSIGEDVLKIAGKYRNGAAHTRNLTRGDLEEFRELLFERETGLLYRLVELGRRVEAIRINQ